VRTSCFATLTLEDHKNGPKLLVIIKKTVPLKPLWHIIFGI